MIYIKNLFNKIKSIFKKSEKIDWEDKALILSAKLLMNSEIWRETPDFHNPKWIQEKGFSVYSQFDDDGIIQYLIYYLNLNKKNSQFIEFGVGDYYESTTHFLLINNRWKGFIIDGDKKNIDKIKSSSIYWRYNINAKTEFITKENIQNLLNYSLFNKIELLHIDLDGNDYWIIQSLDLNKFCPDILILEYNAVFGANRNITVPYNDNFNRFTAHHSGKYFGASLGALNYIAEKKGYYFIGCNKAGNNAYFVLTKYMPKIPKINLLDGYQAHGFREARNKNGKLIYSNAEEEIKTLKGMPVFNVLTKQQELI
jgi:hypothetical protein